MLALCAVSAIGSSARAHPFQYGEVEGVANLELSYGVLARGDASSANFDDGDLNYDQGIVSNEQQVSAELAARWSIFGVYLRGLSFYDFESELAERERTSLTTHAEYHVGSDSELREYFADSSFLLRGMPVRVRVGDQILSWGETAFLRFGVPGSNPLDMPARAGSGA